MRAVLVCLTLVPATPERVMSDVVRIMDVLKRLSAVAPETVHLSSGKDVSATLIATDKPLGVIRAAIESPGDPLRGHRASPPLTRSDSLTLIEAGEINSPSGRLSVFARKVSQIG